MHMIFLYHVTVEIALFVMLAIKAVRLAQDTKIFVIN